MTLCREAYGRDIIARGRALAEQRLAHLAELFESGRWRRFHSEQAFLENIREARQAVQVWRDMAMRGESAVKTASLQPALSATAHAGLPGEQVHTVQPKSVNVDVETSVPVMIASLAGDPIDEGAIVHVTPAEKPQLVPELPLAVDNLKDRYPLLRNAF